MFILQLITIIFPIYSLAGENDGVVPSILSKTTLILNKAWHYKLFILDSQSITVSSILIGITSLIIGLKIAVFLSNQFKKKLFSIVTLDNNSSSLIGRVIDYIFTAVIVIIALDIARVPITIFTFIGGAFVISIGLSSQHLINNFISGVSLIVEGKVKVGDLIEFDGLIGRVESIEARMIELKMQNNLQIFIPHSKLMQEHFINWSYNNNRVRICTNIKIDQKDHINNDIEALIINAVTQNREVLAIPKPQVLLLEFDDNLIHYEVNFWINLNNSDRRQVMSKINNQIFNSLKAHHVQLGVRSRRQI